MASPAQIAANRKNARKSTGPKTPEGKAAVAQNAVRHGLSANTPVIPGEDMDAYIMFRVRLMEELYPKGPLEAMLADRIIELAWRLKRTGRIQAGTFDALTARNAEKPENASSRADTPTLSRLAVEDFASAKVLDRLLVHERRIEHSLYKTMLELQRLQFIRTKYQSLISDGEDYNDYEIREITENYKKAYGHLDKK